MRIVGGVFATEEKDFTSKFLTRLARKVCGAVAAIETRYVGIGLLKAGMFLRCNGEVGNNVQTVATTCGPSGHDANNNFGHEANEALHFKNMQAAHARRVAVGNVVAFNVLIAIFATNALVAATAKCPATIFGRRAISGEKYTTHIAALPRVVERCKKFIYRVWAKRIAHFWSIEGNANCSVSFCTMVRNVGEVKLRNVIPLGSIENIGNSHVNIVPSLEVRNLIFVTISY